MFEYDELLSYYTHESFNTVLSKDRELIIQESPLNKGIWELNCNSNDSKLLNKFYLKFPEGNPEGSWEYILIKAKEYYL